MTSVLDKNVVDEEGLEFLATTFKALSDPTRLKILRYLAEQATCCNCACDLESLTGLSQPTISHHMKILLRSGLVSGEKQGRWMYYRVDSDGLESLQKSLTHLTT